MHTKFFLSLLTALLMLSGAFPSVFAANTDDLPPRKPVKTPFSLDEFFAAVKKIDGFVDHKLDEKKLEKTPKLSSESFVRRAYLDIAGRIPTYQETLAFLRSTDVLKRRNLIKQLMDSDGYVSHNYHFWADLLRLKTRLNNQVPGGPVYIDWVKKNLRDNKPYDEIVYELLTAEGYLWDDPAVGYYLRDPGMPLDNMANTVQVFMGTRLQCAQCHDHPFDDWTQIEFYEMAAHTFGVNTRKTFYQDPEMRKARMIAQKKGTFKGMSRQTVQRSFRTFMEPIIYGAHETDRDIRLPKDYQYDDAKPFQKVAARPMFGKALEVGPEGSQREAYARWMTSPENPRFAQVIANRMWKKVMGVGLIEPVDDLKSDTNASIPELMDYLTELMVRFDFDLKLFQQVLFNTQTYQREAFRGEIDIGQPYYFPGPALRRMSAEQLWDSYLSLMLEDLDKRQIPDFQTLAQTRRLKNFEERAEKIEKMKAEEIVEAVAQVSAIERKYADRQAEVRSKLADADSEEERGRVRREFGQLRREMYMEMGDSFGMKGDGGMMKGGFSRDQYQNRREFGKKLFDARWRGFPKEMVRASEVSSPAPAGHFLQQFGQSDREVIENANDEASIPQALALLNGKGFQLMKASNSLVKKTYEKMENPTEELNGLFLSILNRYPRDEERDMFAAQTKGLSKDKRFDHTVWVLTNSQEFRFVQ